ncbi:MAG: UspA domain protein, partial [Phenylobacterium sp.]|nr:UspA domain protein [Phenylobacterium sp.]
MTYRSILAYADAAPEASVRLKIAAALAARTGATLDGLFVKPLLSPAPTPIDGLGYIPPSTWEALAESHQAFVTEAEAAARTAFRSAVEAAGARAEWTAIEESAAWGFIGLARCSDLVVFPMSGMTAPRLTAMELARESAAPLVLVPEAPAAAHAGRKVLVAWNGSREAASALHGAWPILEAADRVELLMVEPRP